MKKTVLLFIFLFFYYIASVNAESIQGEPPKASFSMVGLESESDSIFMVNSKAGSSLSFKVRVNNISGKASSFKIYATDVLPTLRGGWSYPASSDSKILVGSWFKEVVMEGTLQPGAGATYAFTMDIPGDVKDGQYIGAIVLEEFIPAPTIAANSEMAIVSDMYIRLPIQTVVNINRDKAIHKMEVNNVYHEIGGDGLVSIFIPHHNLGTILEKPSGTLTLKNSSGDVVKSEQYAMDSVYVGTSGLYDMRVSDVLRPGSYNLNYTINYQDIELKGEYKFKLAAEEVISALDKAQQVGKTHKSWLLEILYLYWIWVLVILTVIIILLLIFVILLIRRGREKKFVATSIKQGEIFDANESN
ncbi:hypothetical protein [Paenibacillus sp. L3-i20]|uniref:COG1470 family protein n=1 Tax=Paenibacillus sp. L3-i20 TaxID=2905833 RepID=UPI001EDD9826|nr:hypothetical protein [Paenibacillus sp. L3-i20]GKU77611.1 hypothetical protein L3i20_v220080 [Paenibacillus sp. L3-i20]